MKVILRSALFIILAAVSASGLAEDSSWLKNGRTQLAEYNRLISAGNQGTQAYKWALDACESYSNAIKESASNSPEYLECRKALRELFPAMSDAAYHFANVGAQDKVLRYACAYIDISLLPAFADAGCQDSPTYPILANLAATNLFNRGEYAKATDYYKAYLNTTDTENRELAFEGLARCFYEQHDYDWAAYIASQGASYYPTNWNMLLIGIESYGHGGNDEKMAPLLEMALSLQPQHKGLLEYQGKMYERQKKFDNAARIFERLFAMNDMSLDYALHLGFNLYNAATTYVHKSKSPDTPADESAQANNLARACFSKAAPLLQRVHENTPYAANVARALAMCYAMINDGERLEKANESLAALRVNSVSKYEIPKLDLSYKPMVKLEPVADATMSSGPSSDVDINIPQTDIKNEKTYVIIFGNEKYKHHESVPYAYNDGKVFAEYCHKVLGVPDDNIRQCYDATFSEINEQINYLEKRTEMSPDQLDIIFYYAGHGIPDVSDRSSYLLPVDSRGTDFATCISLNSLYDRFDNMSARNVTVFLDACFSGATRSNEMLFKERFAELDPEDFVAKGNTVIFSATNGKQTAMGYDEQQHGFFTYYLLKSLQESKGQITLKELADKIRHNVETKTLDKKHKCQSPNVSASATLGDTWHSRTLL